MAERLLNWLTKRGGINALKKLSRHFAKTQEAIIELKKLLEEVSEGKEIVDLTAKISLMEEGCDHIARSIAREIQKGKLPPIDREEILRLLGIQEEITDWIKETAITIRIIPNKEKERVPKEVWKSYVNMCNSLVEEIKAYNACLNKIPVNVNEAYKLKLEVERIEHIIDEEYFKLKEELYFKHANTLGIPLFAIMRDVLDIIEHIADLTEDASDLVQVIMARISAMLFASE